jgi:hypothetical protein
MASHRTSNFEDTPYIDPTPLPSSIPAVDELGVTSAPLKSAAFFIGDHCREVNGETERVALCLSLLGLKFLPFCIVWDSDRGLYALQVGEPGPGALFEGRS